MPLGSEWISHLLRTSNRSSATFTQIGYWHLWVLHDSADFLGLARIQNREFSDRDDQIFSASFRMAPSFS